MYFYYFVLVIFANISYCSKTLDKRLEEILGRDDLRCPDKCLNTAFDIYYEDSMECCFCEAKPYWMNNQTLLGKLNVTILDDGKVILTYGSSLDNDYYSVVFRNENLSFIPENICSFTNLVYIDFSYNNIWDISAIACSVNIDTLILRGNKVVILKNDFLNELKNLRVLDLSYNHLKCMEPGLLLNMRGSLSFLDVSHNLLKVVDVTNMVLAEQQYFCKANYSFNLIESVSNADDWRINSSLDYGHGGYFDFGFNKFKYFINFQDIGFTNITLFGKLYYYSYDFLNNDWYCDCLFYPIVAKALLPVLILKTERLDLKCRDPPEFKDKIIHTFFNRSLDLLICNISIADKCPPQCHCYYQPSQNRTIVNCRSSLSSNKLPLALPEDVNLFVDFSENKIFDLKKEFLRLLSGPEGNYTRRVKQISFAYNGITVIPDIVIHQLQNASLINFTGNPITSISNAVRRFQPCNITLGKLYITCTCGNLWLREWLLPKCYNYTDIFCQTDTGIKSIVDIDKREFECDENKNITLINVTFGILLAVVALVSFVVYYFRTELYILRRHYMNTDKSPSPSYLYDIYISCNEDDPELRHWISNTLEPYLCRYKYKIFLPCRDLVVGRPREEEIMNVLSNAKNTLIILSEYYPDSLQPWISHEWKYAWINYRKDNRRNMIIVNYDMLCSNEVSNKYIKAFVRLGKYIDFVTNEKRIGKTIADSIGSPVEQHLFDLGS